MEIEELDKRIERLQAIRAFYLISGIILGVMWLVWLVFIIINMTGSNNMIGSSQIIPFFMSFLSAFIFVIGFTFAQTKIELYRAMRDLYRETLGKKSSHTDNTTAASS